MTESFIPCCTDLFAIYVCKDGSIIKSRVHAFKVKIDAENFPYLEPLIIVDNISLDSASDASNFVGLVDDTFTEKEIQELAQEKLEEMKKEEERKRRVAS